MNLPQCRVSRLWKRPRLNNASVRKTKGKKVLRQLFNVTLLQNLCVLVCVNVFVSVCVCVCVCAWVCVCAGEQVSISVWVSECLWVLVCVDVKVSIYPHECKYVHIHTCVGVGSWVNECVCLCEYEREREKAREFGWKLNLISQPLHSRKAMERDCTEKKLRKSPRLAVWVFK